MKNAAHMAKLFDVDVESALNVESSDYGATADEETGQSFDKRVEDVRAALDPEPQPQTDPETDIITKAREEAKKSPPQKVIHEVEPEPSESTDKPVIPTEEMVAEAEAEASEAYCGDDVDELEIPGDVIAEVDADMARLAAEAESSLLESESEREDEREKAPITEAETPSPSPAIEENPLALTGEYLKAYYLIKEKYPNFVLYDGSRAYQGFYRFKVMVLSNILREFPLLELDDMAEELASINLRQFINADEVNPDVVRTRIDDVYRQKVRVSELLMSCYHQFFVWEREVEMLKSKLWKDHELKGSHRRDGLTLEHLFDLEQYYNRLKGFMEAARQTDATLKAAADSLSRQLTCLQIKEQINVPSHRYDSPTGSEAPVMATLKSQPQLKSQSEPDVISDGSVITAPQPGGTAHPVDFGVDESDDIAEL
jgi:hypothetical protein